MKCCQDNTQNKDSFKKNEPPQHSNPQEETYNVTLNVSKDKALTYTLVGLVIATVVIGYTVISNKSRAQQAENPTNANVQEASQTNTDDMASHHGGANKKFEPLPQGSVAPDFSLPSTIGRNISLSDYIGKDVLLFFNEGVMCSPCWQEVSRLERYRADFDNLNAVIIPISVDDQQTWDPILKEEKIVTPILIDSERKVATAYKVLGTPSSMHDDRPGHTYVHIKPDGKIHASVDFPTMNSPTTELLKHIKESQS